MDSPAIHSYRNSLILRYPTMTGLSHKKTILVKISRNAKMDSFWNAINADIHQNIPTEYQSLEFVFNGLAGQEEFFSAIRRLTYIENYHAIVMEEFPSRTLRQLLVENRSNTNAQLMNDLRDAARKTGRWLYHFHHRIHTPTGKPYSNTEIL